MLPNEIEKNILSYLDIYQFMTYVSVSSNIYKKNSKFITNYRVHCNKFLDTTFETEGFFENVKWRKSKNHLITQPKKNMIYHFIFDDIEWHLRDLIQIKDFDLPIYNVNDDLDTKRKNIFISVLS